MTHMGIGVKDKKYEQVKDHLSRWLDKDEVIIALFNANHLFPMITGMVLTNRRMITTYDNGTNIKAVSEICADDILDFITEQNSSRSRKLIVVKKNGEKLFPCVMSQEDIPIASSLIVKMSGAPQPIREKIEIAKKTGKADKQVVEQEHKKAVLAAITARGKEIGSAYVDYIGGYGSEYKKTHWGSYLRCYENEVYFKERNITIPANQIVSFEVTGKQQTNSRLTLTRMVTLGVFSLAAPKRSTEKEASIYIGLKDGRQLFFHTTTYAESEIHKKLANAISHYSSLQVIENSQQQTQTLDIAGEIARFAELKKQGILTDDEFQAKKKQLLGL